MWLDNENQTYGNVGDKMGEKDIIGHTVSSQWMQ
jgi:hypothetical protein